MTVYAVLWELPFEGGGLDSLWSSCEAAYERCCLVQAADRLGSEYSVVPFPLDEVPSA